MMTDEITPRRLVLRVALASAFSLLVPITLFGARSTGANSAAAATTKKLAQAGVLYQTKPKGEKKCSSCMNFIAESKTCKLVDGSISPDGWCILWAKKA